MTLRKKTLAIIAVTSVSLIAILYVISRIFLLGGYARLEEQSTHQNVERLLSALSEEITVLDTTVFDWASWNDTYTFIEDCNPDYVQSNLIDETFLTIRLNLMLFVDAFGQKVFTKGFDLHNETEVPVPQAFLGDLLANDLLISHHETKSSVTGIVLLSEGPMLVASRPILTSEDEGPIRGALVMGRYLDTTEIERLAQVTHLSFTVQRFSNSLLPPDFQEARVALSGKETMLVRPISDESIAGYTLLEDIYGKPALFLRVDMPREIYKQGQASIVVFTSLLLAASLAFGIVTLLLLERHVLSRLAHLGRSVSRIGARGDLSARVAMGETDEISRVASSSNEMLSELEQSEKALRESEARFRHLYDSNMLGIAFWKSSGLIEDANDAYLDMIGYDRQELQSGKVRWQDITPPEHAHLDKKGLEELRATGICPPFEKEYIRKDGTRIPVLIGAAFLNGEDDTGVSYLVNLTERERAEEALRQRAIQLQTIGAVGRRVSSILDLDELLSYVVETIQQSFDYYHVDIFLVDQDQDYAVFRTSSNPTVAERRKEQPQRFKVGKEGMIGWVTKAGESLLANDVSQEPRYLPDELLPEIKSELAVPLKVEEQTIGVLDVDSDRLNAFSKDDIFVLETLGHQVAIAIENARMYKAAQQEVEVRKHAEEALRRRANELAALQETLLDTIAPHDLTILLRTIVERATQLLNARGGGLYLCDPEKKEVRCEVSYNTPGDYRGTVLNYGEGAAGTVAETGEPLLIDDYRAWNKRASIFDKEQPFTTVLSVPLTWQDQVMGVIHILDDVESHRFTKHDQELLTAFANYAAVALNNAHLFEEAQHRAEEMAVLNELSQVLTARLNVEEVLVEAYHQASRLVDTTNFYISLYDEEKDEITFPFNVSESEIDNQITIMSASQGLTGYIIRNRTSVLLGENGFDWQEEKGVETFGQEAPSWLGVPLMIGDRVLGVMVVQSYTTPNLYDEHDRDLLTAIASPTAIALENAQLFEAVQQELAERMRTEKALRESEGRFRRLYDSNTLGIVYWDSSDRLVDANEVFLDIIGYTRQDMLAGNLHLQDITPLEYRHLDKKGFDELRKTGTCSPFEKEYVRKDGTRVSVLIGGAFLESGGEVGVSYVIDVTERKQMEKALHASEERFALAVQGANDGIWDWDIQNNSLYWSPRMKELLGYADDELDVYFDTFESILHPDDREHTKAVMEARLKDGQLYDVDHRLRTKSGEYRWFHARGQVILDKDGNPVRMIGSTADVTDRKRAEERLHVTLYGMIEALGQTTETRDLYTAGHQKRVTQLACAIAKEMGLSKEHIEGIRIAGLVHDIGKMAIPAEILSKPSRLSEMEYGLIKAHPKIAYDVIKTIEFPWPVAQIVLQHHERMDGSGYPQGLKGEQILMEARILAVADVVEAMASHRPYRPALGIDKALEEIAQKKSTLYDVVVVDTCLRLFYEKKFSFEGDPSPGEA